MCDRKFCGLSLCKNESPEYWESLWMCYPGTSGQEDVNGSVASNVIVATGGGGGDSSWLPALPHVLTAAMANFMFGYHIGCVTVISCIH